MSKKVNKLRKFLKDNVAPTVRENLIKEISDEWKISNRSLDNDLMGYSVPEWRQKVWTNVLSKESGISLAIADLFPEQTEAAVKLKSTKEETVKQ